MDRTVRATEPEKLVKLDREPAAQCSSQKPISCVGMGYAGRRERKSRSNQIVELRRCDLQPVPRRCANAGNGKGREAECVKEAGGKSIRGFFFPGAKAAAASQLVLDLQDGGCGTGLCRTVQVVLLNDSGHHLGKGAL